MNVQNLFKMILGFLVIIITLALGPTIYTANAVIVAAANTTFIGLSVVAGFGAFIIIFGLLFSGGFLAIMGKAGAGAGKADFMKVIGSVIMIVIMLTLMNTAITYVATLHAAAVAASDTLGSVGFGLIPVIIYLGIVSLAGWAHISTIRKLRKGRRARLSRAYL